MLNHSLSTPILSLQKGGQFAAILRGQFVRLFHVGPKTRKPLTSKGFLYLLLFLFIVDYRRLFADTKIPKNILQQIIIRHGSSDQTQLIQGFPEFERQ